MKTPLLLLLSLSAVFATGVAADSKIASSAVNALGVDLYRARARGEDNLLLSPYSLQNVLAMSFAGAAGKTHEEMQRVLHFPADENALHASFGALEQELATLVKQSAVRVREAKKIGGPSKPIELNVANRLFAEKDYLFRPSFLDLVQQRYAAPLEKMDCQKAPEKARLEINRWAAAQTKGRIGEVVPPGVITPATRLTLVNALYLRAPWADEFSAAQPERFLAHGKQSVEVPTIAGLADSGYAKHFGFQVVTRPYYGGQLQFIIFLPDSATGVASLAKKLTPKLLQECAHLPTRQVTLHLPKLHLAPSALALGDSLQALGMKTAFNIPAGSADFDRMTPRQPGSDIYISSVLQKTLLQLDEKGTVAVAVTTTDEPIASEEIPGKKPLEVRVDHPFLFAIQHVPSGACLFLGRITDPR